MMKITHRLSLILIVVIFPVISVFSQNQTHNISILFYDLSMKNLDDQKIKSISETIEKSQCEIAIFAAISNQEILKKIITSNSSFKYRIYDRNLKNDILLLISKIKPQKFSIEIKEYKIKNDKNNNDEILKTKPFIITKFMVENYEFYTICASVKDKTPVPEFNQFDMRRYEIRQLRYIFDDIIKEEPEANILILGNLNDTCDMSTVKEIYARRYGNKKRLFDIRPIDKLKTTWTSWNQETDEYERICYALCSYHMLPELIREESQIIWNDDWLSISNNRPLLLKFTTTEMQEFSDKYLNAIYPNSIYSEIAAHFEKDKLIGEKAKRKSPEYNVKNKK
ncbi:MAG TPA: hypothetical protein P5105_00285 [Victivallales bacterium]|nr:hypothetical protein [Victivallales bacterium]